ncbi:NIPSNAP family containing protein [Streptomyces sp. TRM43335]|uniref:NIPSNAP family containing protein n=1 Tax=Streptomyces taklimakanensis TaxID=2569853 RepID=A0A6G2BGT9_9ACTN|nr:NIPSNAP family protein [Streptomyces taklimakanensis]MTE21501.1 NIPSNAP family containing protein [Streptomyces taklimakanensis]
MAKTTQLRTYTVRDGMLDEWVERWRREIVPLRLKLGFTIDGAWVDRERGQFVWLISCDGPETFAERNAAYWSSPEREAMNLDPDDYLVRTEDRVVEQVY